MSVQSEIARIKSNIANAYNACEDGGATIPQTQDSANLASTISTIAHNVIEEIENGSY